MVALAPLDQSRCRFHLGVSNFAGVDAGDAAEIVEAMNNITDDYTLIRVLQQLDICDEAWLRSRPTLNSGQFSSRETYAGDIDRTILRHNNKDYRVWTEIYMEEVRALAQLLWVPNYREQGMDKYRFTRAAGAFVRALPGIADTAVSARRLEFSQLAGSFGY